MNVNHLPVEAIPLPSTTNVYKKYVAALAAHFYLKWLYLGYCQYNQRQFLIIPSYVDHIDRGMVSIAQRVINAAPIRCSECISRGNAY